MRLRRRNTAWLAIMGAMVAIVVIAGAVQGTVSAGVAALLVGLFALAAAASLVEFQPGKLLNTSGPSPLERMRMSPQAREAVERARRRSSYSPSGITLMDVGLISLQSNSDGMVMRRSRAISQDDDGVRPYVTLHVRPEEADRNALIRYEILDQNGKDLYIHEMKTYMRDGEMNILADHHLPLFENERITEVGDWDLRVYIDGSLLGALSFNVTPSLRDRMRRMERGENRSYRLVDEADDSPVTLEDLLRSQSRDNHRS